MDDAPKSSVVFHKEKEAKRKTNVISTIDNSLIDNSTVVKDTRAVKSITEQLLEHQNSKKAIAQQQLLDREKQSRLIANAEIDECLQGFVMEGLTSVNFLPWVAKCCHTLGLQKVNTIAIAARNGKTRDRLFSCLLKGAMALHAKKQFYADGSTPSIEP
jgi:hypothetical protein